MAGLSSKYLLKNFKSEVRAMTSTISQQETGVLDLQINDLIYHSILNVRSALDWLVDDFYRNEISLTPGTPSGTGLYTCTVLAAGALYDLSKVSMWDDTLFEIPVYSRKKFDGLRALYSKTDFGATKGIATIFAIADGTIQPLIYSGAATITTAKMIGLKVPSKAAVDATDYIDLPDRWVPLAIDHCVLQIFRRLGKTPPADVEQRVSVTAGTIAQMLGVAPDPQRLG